MSKYKLLPSPWCTLCGIGEDPCIFRLFNHGHLFVSAMGFTNDIKPFLSFDKITILASSPQPALDFKSTSEAY